MHYLPSYNKHTGLSLSIALDLYQFKRLDLIIVFKPEQHPAVPFFTNFPSTMTVIKKGHQIITKGKLPPGNFPPFLVCPSIMFKNRI